MVEDLSTEAYSGCSLLPSVSWCSKLIGRKVVQHSDEHVAQLKTDRVIASNMEIMAERA
jgi:hypothetical protein